MNERLVIDPTRARALGHEILDKTTSFNNELSKVKNANNSIADTWKGTAASSYTNAVGDQAKALDALVAKLNAIGEYLVKAADIYERAESDITVNR